MKNQRKPLKYYLLMYVLIMLFTGGYTVFMLIRGTLEVSDLWLMLTMPVLFVFFLFLFDTLRAKIFSKKPKVDLQKEFLMKVSEQLRATNEFGIEDYRKLQLNQRFQDSLRIAYTIASQGETEDKNLSRLEKKFDKRTIEGKAMHIVARFVKELRN
ncbi:MAG: hypothetical protein Q8M70_01230 [bacterium]|nr:hypothetical protein [bacterium]